MVGWRHAFGDTTPTTTSAFAGGDAFTIAGTPIAEDALVLEAGFDVGLAQKATLGLSYSGQIASKASDHGFRADSRCDSDIVKRIAAKAKAAVRR